ncbi:MAG: iron ABC transporter permease [Candidatus Bathyarchaeia archaeon]|nr:iron ABC transporter permease [Candidatus Bathyarchaeota archaeon]
MKTYTSRFLLLVCILIIMAVLSVLFVGRYTLNPFHSMNDEMALTIILRIRLPRVLTAIMLGMALSVAGAVMQAAFKNPLVGPEVLGVSQGAAFGAALAILFLPGDPLKIQLLSAVFGLLALATSYMVSSAIRYGGRILRLVLAGLAVSATFSAGVGVMKFLADPLKQLPELTFWLLGGLSGVVWRNFLYMAPLATIAIIILFILRWRINLLILDDDVIISLGTDPKKLRATVITLAVIATAAVTSIAGIIGWIGLTIPHICRKLFGAENSRVIPASILLGAILMLIFDDIARTVSAGEIPLGIITSLLGAVLFVIFLSRGIPHE